MRRVVAQIFIIGLRNDFNLISKSVLEDEDFPCFVVSNLAEARRELSQNTPELVIVNGEGFTSQNSWVADFIAEFDSIPGIILVKANSGQSLDWLLSTATEIQSCQIALVDAVRKFFSEARSNQESPMLIAGDLHLDKRTEKAYVGHHEAHLTPSQFKLLCFLMSTPGKVYTRKQLLIRLWDQNMNYEQVIDVEIGRIRKELKRKLGRDPFRTVKTVGYAFNEFIGSSRTS